jgi:hypothetical protein
MHILSIHMYANEAVYFLFIWNALKGAYGDSAHFHCGFESHYESTVIFKFWKSQLTHEIRIHDMP